MQLIPQHNDRQYTRAHAYHGGEQEITDTDLDRSRYEIHNNKRRDRNNTGE